MEAGKGSLDLEKEVAEESSQVPGCGGSNCVSSANLAKSKFPISFLIERRSQC